MMSGCVVVVVGGAKQLHFSQNISQCTNPRVYCAHALRRFTLVTVAPCTAVPVCAAVCMKFCVWYITCQHLQQDLCTPKCADNSSNFQIAMYLQYYDSTAQYEAACAMLKSHLHVLLCCERYSRGMLKNIQRWMLLTNSYLHAYSTHSTDAALLLLVAKFYQNCITARSSCHKTLHS
eukprot:9197-Heterococcus_DN1.PRE.1